MSTVRDRQIGHAYAWCRCIWSTRRTAAAYAGTDNIRPELLQRVGDKRRAAQEFKGNNAYGRIDMLQLRSTPDAAHHAVALGRGHGRQT